MLCQWPKCNEPAILEWCEEHVCDKHIRAIKSMDVREARRILNVDDMVMTTFRFIGVVAQTWPRNRNKKKKTSNAKPIF